eukprot:TRINITY_DN6971_c0_g1_i1.p1 TRINITY_DN6971_c0_g1~~TRINITY_DN6971_c0_g1_i1.p1  ORF type:complete len:554 (-),score=115.27 TRINITY_DN6971_c0_g1_i1:8-1669(-)
MVSCAASSISNLLFGGRNRFEGVFDIIRENAGQKWWHVKGRYHMPPSKLSDDYVVKSEVLGTGLTGDVHLARCKHYDRVVAVKSYRISRITRLSESQLAHIKKTLAAEVEIALQMDHGHVVRLLDVYESDRGVDMVMEYLGGGSLLKYIKDTGQEGVKFEGQRSRRLPESEAAALVLVMLQAVSYMHTHGVVHRDLKPANFAFQIDHGERGHLKLLDFGLSTNWDGEQRLDKFCGTLFYKAPELFERKYDSQADLWSLGVIAFQLLLGMLPFEGNNNDEMQHLIATTKYSDRAPKLWKKLSEPARDFLCQLLVRDPKLRLTAEKALQHPWILEAAEQEKLKVSRHISASEGLRFAAAMRTYTRLPTLKHFSVMLMAWATVSEERGDAFKIHKIMDNNGDGKCTIEELEGLLGKELELPAEEVNETIKAIIDAGWKYISFTDVITSLILCHRIPMSKRTLQYAFNNLKDNECNCITEESLRAVAGDEIELVPVEQVFSEALLECKGKRGRISYEDFVAYVTNISTDEHPAEELKQEEARPERAMTSAGYSGSTA